MEHDQVWKELLWTNFREFIELFYPDVAERLDLTNISLRDKELFTDFTTGNRRELDVLAEVNTKDGEPEIILVHVEIQTRRDSDIPFRMWQYYSLLRLRHNHKVFPLVVYLSPGAGGLTEERYSEELFGRNILAFNYSVVGLPDLSADEYLEKDNILAPALSALMRSERMDNVTRKLRSYEQLARARLNDARSSLLINVVDSYLKLNMAEETEFQRRLLQEEPEEVSELITQWEERGIKKGIEKGIEQGLEQGISQGISQGINEGLAQGKVRGKQETLLRLIRHKFGEIPESMAARIDELEGLEQLDSLIELLVDANTLDEMGIDKLDR